MNMREYIEDYDKQILDDQNYFFIEQQRNWTITIDFSTRFYLLIFLFLICTSQSKALPILSIQHPLLVDQSTSSLPSYKIYRAHSLPSYSIVQRQFKRERYRRTMIDRLFSQFDEDVDGRLSKDELYSFSLRLNIFPRFHYFLKNQQQRK